MFKNTLCFSILLSTGILVGVGSTPGLLAMLDRRMVSVFRTTVCQLSRGMTVSAVGASAASSGASYG